MINKEHESLLHIKKIKFDTFVFWACVIDLLFLPYVWFINVPYTLPLLVYWVIVKQKKLLLQKEYTLFVGMLIIMVVSTFVGYLVTPIYISQNLVFLLQFTFIFLYYFLFSYYAEKYYLNIKKILILFLTFVLLLAVIYNIDKFLYHDIKLIWNLRSGTVINQNFYVHFEGYRYSFYYMDPNNIAYLMNSVVLYLWCNEKTSLLEKLYSLVALIVVLISAMSNGGFIAFGVSVAVYILISFSRINTIKIKKKVNIMSMSLLSIIPFIIIYFSSKIFDFINSPVVKESMNRVESNSGESRITIWKRLIENVNFIDYIFFGRGGVTLVNNTEYASHNGHFFWILGYGLISYLIFMYILFRKKEVTPLNKYIWIISIFIGFSINILIGEIKLMGVVVLLIACSRSNLYLKNSLEDKLNE